MKAMLKGNYVPNFLIIGFSFLMIATGCNKPDAAAPLSTQNNSNAVLADTLGNFQMTVLAANTSGYGTTHIDSNLHNAWGMSTGSGGGIWVSAADGGVSYVYNNAGDELLPPVLIPSHLKKVTGNPTGNIFNKTTGFIITGTGRPAAFIFASEDGTISAWNGGPAAILVADRSKKASYKGLAIAKDGGNPFLYVTNFAQHKIDVFDENYNYVTGRSFKDSKIPEGYAPFNIREINGMLYVTYALVTEDGDEDSTGAGLGFVDVFWPNGSLSKRFAAHGTLNAPWGITEAKPDLFGMSSILIGNFGDGRINVFDWDGTYKGQLMSNGNPVEIEGLWAIDDIMPKTSPKKLFFTAGPNEEEDGVFGYLKNQ